MGEKKASIGVGALQGAYPDAIQFEKWADKKWKDKTEKASVERNNALVKKEATLVGVGVVQNTDSATMKNCPFMVVVKSAAFLCGSCIDSRRLRGYTAFMADRVVCRGIYYLQEGKSYEMYQKTGCAYAGCGAGTDHAHRLRRGCVQRGGNQCGYGKDALHNDQCGA